MECKAIGSDFRPLKIGPAYVSFKLLFISTLEIHFFFTERNIRLYTLFIIASTVHFNHFKKPVKHILTPLFYINLILLRSKYRFVHVYCAQNVLSISPFTFQEKVENAFYVHLHCLRTSHFQSLSRFIDNWQTYHITICMLLFRIIVRLLRLFIWENPTLILKRSI
jgi:hypothetical protein